ncbi:TetR/AcrR family transcriptional regulator [Ensifer soli]|uniref:TetR/AcrR family transcriptional regulator n=1 Tax=Ciceribacter sp. sgz301302 TaxID=3342379 RepID=UPI0035B74E31
MTARDAARPGGRSARVQASVHGAVRTLLARAGRDQLTIPQIAAEAGVTPSTIYRRWGDLQELLGDVAVEHLRPDADPPDAGSLAADLFAWGEQYAEEMASAPGRALIRDVMASRPEDAGRCCAYTRQQLSVIAGRARRRGEPVPSVETMIDHVVAPIMYRILFDADPVTAGRVRDLVARLMQACTGSGQETPEITEISSR